MTDGTLDPELWRRLEPILDRALELSGKERRTYLDEACAGDSELRAQIDALLEADDSSHPILDSPVEAVASEILDDDGADRTEALEHGAGSHIGPYQIVRMIGAGGMGVVYEAKDTRLGRRIALKFLPPEYGRDPGAKERFLREARAASALDHPSVCNIHDIGETDDGRLYIVMAYYEGQTLKERLKEGPLTPEEARDIARHLARGLRRAHDAGIVHRDIKPANVMLTASGRPVLLDFGVAKFGGDADLTKVGSTLGTPAYMSPEQARGRPADQRSDLWSLGTVFYEMLAGRRPFEGGDPQTAIFAILNEDPKPLPDEVPAEIAEVVGTLLKKNPDERYENAGALLAALGGSETQTILSSTTPAKTWRRTALALGLVALSAIGWLLLRPATAPVAESGDRASLAVLFFDNLTNDENLDWMRTGITDMLVTDLAQSPGIEVLSTSKLHQILDDLGVLEQAELGFETLQAVADASGVAALVSGSYLRQGEVLQIAFRIDDLAGGTVLESGRFQGRGEESLFAVVDELSTAIRTRFEVAASPDRPETIQAVTTESEEAWRFYTQALDLHRRARDREAVALLEQAVEIDPNFALALVNLGRFNRNIGHAAKARVYYRRAIAQRDRLPIDRRLSVEAAFYGAQWGTYGKAIETYRQAIEERPDAGNLRTNMANRLIFFERFEEAGEQFQTLVERDHPYRPMYTSYAWALAAQGRFERGRELLTARLEATPDDWYNRTGFAEFLTVEGRYDDADEQLAQAIRLRPLDQFVQWTAYRLASARGNLERAEAAAGRLAASTDPWELWRAEAARSRLALLRGRSAIALERLDGAAAAYPEPDAQAAVAHNWAARLLLQLDRPQEALSRARLAVELGVEEFGELEGRMWTALALAKSGDLAGAGAERDLLEARWREQPNPVEERQWLRLDALLALEQDDPEAAVAFLEKAEALLPARGIEFHDHVTPDHVPIRFDLARAHLAAGRPDVAREWFERVASAGSERLPHPVLWVRSFYWLGSLAAAAGESEPAAAAYRRFADSWRDGDLDRERIFEALAALDG